MADPLGHPHRLSCVCVCPNQIAGHTVDAPSYVILFVKEEEEEHGEGKTKKGKAQRKKEEVVETSRKKSECKRKKGVTRG